MADDLSKDFASEEDLSKDFASEPDMKAAAPAPAGRTPPPPIPSTGQALEKGLLTGAVAGMSPQAAGLGAGIQQAVAGDIGKPGGRSWQDIVNAYKGMKDATMKENEAAKAAHPYIYGAGSIAGSIPLSVAGAEAGLGPGAQGAVLGAGSYLGETKDPTLAGTAAAAGTGALLGKGAEAAIPAVGKAIKGGAQAIVGKAASMFGGKVAPEVMQDAFQRGVQGESLPLFPSNKFNNSPQGRAIASETQNAAMAFTNRMKSVEQSLGSDIGQSIQDADSQGVTANVENELKEFKQQVQDGVEANRIRPEEADQINKSIDSLLYQEEPQEAEQMGTFKTTQRYERGEGGELIPVRTSKTVKVKGANADDLQNVEDAEDAIPEEAEEGDQQGQLSTTAGSTGKPLKRSVTDTTKLMSPATEGVTRGDLPVQRLYGAKQDFNDLATSLYNTEGSMPASKQVVKSIQNMLNDKLTEAVPDFGQKLQLYNKFLEYLPETIASKGVSAQLSKTRLSDMPNPELTVQKSVESLISDLNKGGSSSQQAQQTMQQLDHSLDNLATIDKSAAAAAEIQGKPYQSIFTRLGLNKDQIMQHLEARAVKANTVNTWMGNKSVDLSVPTGVVDTIKQATGKTGVAAANLAGRFVGNKLYSANDSTLKGVAAVLTNNPETRNLGGALNDAVDKGDTVARNAAIFSAMQNPKARALIDPSLGQDTNKKNENTPVGTAPSGQGNNQF